MGIIFSKLNFICNEECIFGRKKKPINKPINKPIQLQVISPLSSIYDISIETSIDQENIKV